MDLPIKHIPEDDRRSRNLESERLGSFGCCVQSAMKDWSKSYSCKAEQVQTMKSPCFNVTAKLFLRSTIYFFHEDYLRFVGGKQKLHTTFSVRKHIYASCYRQLSLNGKQNKERTTHYGRVGSGDDIKSQIVDEKK